MADRQVSAAGQGARLQWVGGRAARDRAMAETGSCSGAGMAGQGRKKGGRGSEPHSVPPPPRLPGPLAGTTTSSSSTATAWMRCGCPRSLATRCSRRVVRRADVCVRGTMCYARLRPPCCSSSHFLGSRSSHLGPPHQAHLTCTMHRPPPPDPPHLYHAYSYSSSQSF